MRFGEKEDKFLNQLYDSVGASSTRQKINCLLLNLGAKETDYHIYCGIEPATDELKLALFEYEILQCNGLTENFIYC